MNLKQKKLILLIFVLFAIAVSQLQIVQANIISTASGNRIHFINTKGATGSDAIILESNGHYALIDMGEDYDFPDGSNPRYPARFGISTNNGYVLEDRLFRHMKYLGVKKLDFILGTHVHSDHIGAADEVLKRYPVGKLYLKKYTDERITSKWRLWDNLFNYDNALKTAREKGVTVVQDIKAEDSRFKLGDMDIQLYNYKNEYGPDGKLKKVYDDNSNSLVAVVTVAGKRIYLGGDLDNAEGAEDKLGPVIGKVDMMKWNHHYDAKISNTLPFLDSLAPSTVVHTSSSDANLASTRDYLKNKNIQVVHASSQTKDATVFNISNTGFTNVSDSFPNIPTVTEKWYKEDGYWKYRLSDNQMAIGWKKINGVYYFFNGQGQMQADRWLHLKDSKEKIDGNWYYLKKDGSMQESGWFKHDGAWYYITWSGARTYNELAEIGGQKYLFDKDGKMLTGLQVFNGKKMFFASNGSLQAQGRASSWQKIGVSWYYYDGEGVPSVGLKKINGKTYYFDNYGIMKTGWVFLDGHWNYFTSDGDMKTGWVKDKDIWYYLDKDGVMLTGLQEINGSRYYLNASGAMQTGWKWLDNHYYYFVSSGAMKTGWLKDKDVWYYLDKDGVMLTGFQEIDGSRYYLNASGAMQTGWKWLDNHYYYFTSSGAMKTGWLKDKDTWYYLDKEGIMLTGLQEINGARYYLNASGAMETGWKQLNGNWYYFQTNGSLLRNGTSPDGYKLNADGIWTTVTTEETTQEQTVANSQGHNFETTEVERTQQTESSSVTSEEKNQSTEPKTQTSQENN
ncbi:MBL fold metallo-hydrolase [Streptococcus infantis]|uniref:Metallo-beta-lactamase domain protein n=1 Tax=Streptococcus infantis ATCC 700779 TaxID=889204 RepID=E8JYK6_9STRE|nr:MBL fold metallo-hydrolase [Streptococcus infantis]EFX37388.1 metallo-beta-lactamase domain protein [Streptococcus infantis ATCC 700779]EIG40663.1 metallo-beta-lactamase domain protein [Streptococcus infantis ATCC 700779]SUN81495.1 choline binding protein E CbpE [Streptococcus infantis]